MKTLNYITALLLLILLSPAARAARAPEMSHRDSVMAVVQAAEASDPEALNQLGLWYYNGENVERDYQLAARLWAKSAHLGYAPAVRNLGICYQNGRGVEADSARATELYAKALTMGDPTLLAELDSQAQKGSTFAMGACAEFYSRGIGTKPDRAAAASYYAMLGNLGKVSAMRDAGLNYLNSKQYRDALKWFKKGAAASDTPSTYYYGMMLTDGLGTAKDPANLCVPL